MTSVLAEILAQNKQAPEWGKAAPIGLFVLLAFVVVCFFLFRSMNRRIRKVPIAFDGTDTEAKGLEHDLIGDASTGLPTVGFRDPKGQSAPRLGTPAELERELVAKRKARAKARRRR